MLIKAGTYTFNNELTIDKEFSQNINIVLSASEGDSSGEFHCSGIGTADNNNMLVVAIYKMVIREGGEEIVEEIEEPQLFPIYYKGSFVGDIPISQTHTITDDTDTSNTFAAWYIANTDYVEVNGGEVPDIPEEPDEPEPTKISFSINRNGTKYLCYAEEGMTWREWASSDYNNTALGVISGDPDYIAFTVGQEDVLDVGVDDVIIDGQTYFTIVDEPEEPEEPEVPEVPEEPETPTKKFTRLCLGETAHSSNGKRFRKLRESAIGIWEFYKTIDLSSFPKELLDSALFEFETLIGDRYGMFTSKSAIAPYEYNLNYIIATKDIVGVEVYNEKDGWKYDVWKTIAIRKEISDSEFDWLNANAKKVEAMPELPDGSSLPESVGLAFKSRGDGTCSVSGKGICPDTYIVIPSVSPEGDSVTGVGRRAFMSQTKITSVKIPNSVTVIGDGAFYGCYNLQQIENSNSITIIGADAFRSCYFLEKIVIPNTLETINWGAFKDCLSLNNIIFEGTMEQWGAIRLDSDWNTNIPATYVHCIDGKVLLKHSEGLAFTSNGDGTCYVSGIGTCTSTDIVIPSVSPDGDSVISISNEAFQYCSLLTSITIPDSVTSIGSSAFYYCTSLTSVTIGNSVTSIGHYAFNGCSLTSIEVDSNNGYYKSKNGILYSKDEKTLVRCPQKKDGISFEIPNSVTSIGYYAFEGCSFTSIEIPDSVTDIENGAFRGCSFTSIEIPNSVTSIDFHTFEMCRSLTSITIPNSVTRIGDYAFDFCSSLKSVTLPNSLTSIGEYAFRYCTALIHINFEGTIAQWGAVSEYWGWNYDVPATYVKCTDGHVAL